MHWVPSNLRPRLPSKVDCASSPHETWKTTTPPNTLWSVRGLRKSPAVWTRHRRENKHGMCTTGSSYVTKTRTFFSSGNETDRADSGKQCAKESLNHSSFYLRDNTGNILAWSTDYD